MNRRALLATVLAVAAVGFALASPSQAGNHITQTAGVNWHPNSGNSGTVDGATAEITRSRHGIRYRIDTTSLNPGHAYSVWFVVINDPALCTTSPCAASQFLTDPAADAQVTWGQEGEVGRADGTARFRARIDAGPLLDGWLRVQGLDDPMGAEIHLVLNDHGPVLPGLEREMLSTYRAGCADTSPFPPIFPPTALADGTPGPNTCRLWQATVFPPPGD
jgi:hypothetical protein